VTPNVRPFFASPAFISGNVMSRFVASTPRIV
jgi:hypothetical protein